MADPSEQAKGSETEELLREFFPEDFHDSPDGSDGSTSVGPVAGSGDASLGRWEVRDRVEARPEDAGDPLIATPQPEAGQAQRRPTSEEPKSTAAPGRRRTVIWLLAAFAACLAVGALGFAANTLDLFGDGSSDVQADGADQPRDEPAAVAVGEEQPDVGDDDPSTPDDSNQVTADSSEQTGPGFEVDGTDALGRPVPALPDQLIPNTDNATELPGYYPDPPDVPETGPYTVIRAGRFYLRGTVYSENIRQQLISQRLQFIPQEALVIEYEIDPTETWYFGDPYPVFLEDAVLFEPGSAEINEQFAPIFELGANTVLSDPNLSIRIIGHTDDRGDSAENLDLSRRRAEAVRDRLLELGAPPEQVFAEAKGEDEPIADNSTDEGREINRRVEFELQRSISGQSD